MIRGTTTHRSVCAACPTPFVGRIHVAVAVLERSGAGSFHVRWSVSNRLPTISRDAEVGPSHKLARVVDARDLRYRGDVGLVPGAFDVIAKHLPYDRAGTRVERALALIRPAR